MFKFYYAKRYFIIKFGSSGISPTGAYVDSLFAEMQKWTFPQPKQPNYQCCVMQMSRGVFVKKKYFFVYVSHNGYQDD